MYVLATGGSTQLFPLQKDATEGELILGKLRMPIE